MNSTRAILRGTVILAIAASIVTGWLSPITALGSGTLIGALLGTPSRSAAIARSLMALSIVALGCGIDLAEVARVGRDGLAASLALLTLTFVSGRLLARKLGIRSDVALLVTAGTAICGGSAIAAVAPLIRARAADVAAAIAVVFALNSLALFAFPAIGAGLGMGADEFGTWCALAIHDTSSVVGAAATHSERALELATITKLTRVLWIVPVGLLIVRARSRQTGEASRRGPVLPWFLVAFVTVAALVAVVPDLRATGVRIAGLAPIGMQLALFAVGLGLAGSLRGAFDRRAAGFGLLLWLVLASASLIYLRWIG